MFNDKTTRSEFNSYTKELMIQLLASNDNKFFSKEEDLKKAYDEFEDTIETKKNLLQICNDEQLILDTLFQYNKSYELKESFDIRAEIDMLTLRCTKPLYTTTFEDLEKLRSAGISLKILFIFFLSLSFLILTLSGFHLSYILIVYNMNKKDFNYI